jgi:Dolichyl-phosphate-mannose-protein mannosyltransferase
MLADNRLTDDFATSTLPGETGVSSKKYSRIILVIFALNVISALLFMRFVNRPVYDDPYNIRDVHVYASEGFSVATMRVQQNAPGPTSFLWMAEAVRLLKGEELLDARIGALLSWVLLAAGVFAFIRYGNHSEIWYGALLALLVFPHAVEATATVLTEGPALMFALLGILAWMEFASRPTLSFGSVTLGLLGGLSMGVAVTCRQYNLALLASAACFALYERRQRGLDQRERTLWAVAVILSLAVAAVPVLLLLWVWKGFSSPGMVAAAFYGNWHGVGLNFAKPTIAAFYSLFYLVPLTFPAMRSVKASSRARVLLVSLVGGGAAGYFSSFLLQPGPLHTVVQAISRVPGAGGVFVGLVATVTIYNAVAVCMLLWEQRARVAANPAVIFAVLTIIFFIAEQFGVGGNVPFYDRYILQVAPFLGLVAFGLLPRLTYPRLAALALMSAVSHVMLWRYAFGG